jgi:aryl-alcohol dehydrogenase-like predicted oxidoreductase
MEYRQLGRSGLRVSALSLGTMTFGDPDAPVGMTGAARQLADNLAAAELELSGDERARLDEVSAPPLLYPYWHQAKTASERLSEADLSLLGSHLEG